MEQFLILCHVRQPRDVHRTEGRWWSAVITEGKSHLLNLTMTWYYLFSIFWSVGISSCLFSTFSFLFIFFLMTPLKIRDVPLPFHTGWVCSHRDFWNCWQFWGLCWVSLIFTNSDALWWSAPEASSLKFDPGLYWRKFLQWQKDFLYSALETFFM